LLLAVTGNSKRSLFHNARKDSKPAFGVNSREANCLASTARSFGPAYDDPDFAGY
jgi:hypothetical protein